MNSVHTGPHFPPCPAPFNLAAHVLARAGTLAEKTALQIVRPTGAEIWSYARLEMAVRGTATGLLRLGLAPGARVLLRLGNTPEFPVAFLGAIAAGLVPVPTSAQLTRVEITKMAMGLRPDLVIAGEGVALPDHLARVISEADLRGFETLPAADYAMGDPERLAYMIYTSGTSGNPRAVMHAHRAIWARQMMMDGWYGLTETDRVLHAGAFNWTYTLGTGLMDPWTMGATALIPGAGVEPQLLPRLLKQFDATIFAAAPGVYRQILKHHAKIDAPHLRHGLSAGEALPDTLRTAWNEASGTKIYEALGMSECSTFISSSPDHPAPDGVMGYPQNGRRIAVLGPDGAPVARGEAGNLAVHQSDPGLFLGYDGAPDETAAKFHGDWFLTGDTVSMAQDGAIRYLGRDDDMMNAGGFRVSPIEVESALATVENAGDLAAIELRVKADTTVIACVYTGTADEAMMRAQAEATLARYKQPRAYLHADTLPRNANGKLNRRALRQNFEAQNEL